MPDGTIGDLPPPPSPPPPVPEPIPETIPAPETKTEPELHDRVFEEDYDFEDVPLPPETFKRSRQRQRITSIGSWLVLVLFVISVAGIFIFGRTYILKQVPQMSAVYKSLGMSTLQDDYGLLIQDLTSEPSMQNGVEVLKVTGSITNKADDTRNVPDLQIKLLGQYGQPLYSWTDRLDDPVLQPGDTRRFETRLTSPPAEALRVSVGFLIPED